MALETRSLPYPAAVLLGTLRTKALWGYACPAASWRMRCLRMPLRSSIGVFTGVNHAIDVRETSERDESTGDRLPRARLRSHVDVLGRPGHGLDIADQRCCAGVDCGVCTTY